MVVVGGGRDSREEVGGQITSGEVSQIVAHAWFNFGQTTGQVTSEK